MARSDWKRPTEFSAPEGRRRVALELAYDGRAFNGWQTQNNGISVQETLKQAIIQFLGDESTVVCGSGRTDSGVHAKGQVAHAEFKASCTIPAKAFSFALNAILPRSVRITRSWEAGPDFHARYSAMAREYRYFAVQGFGHDAFTDGLITRFKELPSIEVLNSYASQLIGTHDFTTFASARDICPSKVRDIYESVFYWTSSIYEDKVLCYKICGNAFLYHMVRSLVGSMIYMGLEGYSAEAFKEALDACDRSKAKKTADSDGLYLWRVSYDPEEYRWFEEKYGNK
jgi:tRNA pseudouridine38-40 synthase